MPLAQGAVRGIIHHQERRPISYIKIVDADNVGMAQSRYNAGLFAKFFQVMLPQMGMNDLNRGKRVEVDMFPKVDLSKAPLGDALDQAIVPKLREGSVG